MTIPNELLERARAAAAKVLCLPVERVEVRVRGPARSRGPARTFGDEQLQRALDEHGGIRAAARAVGCAENLLRRRIASGKIAVKTRA